jgi:hypothetical protein
VFRYAPPAPPPQQQPAQQQQRHKQQQQQPTAQQQQQLQQLGASLALLALDKCNVHLSGHGLGRLLLGCPSLVSAEVHIAEEQQEAAPAGSDCLGPHASLRALVVHDCIS